MLTLLRSALYSYHTHPASLRYAPGQMWLKREDIIGRAVGCLRSVGMVTILLNDYPMLKYVLVGIMGLFVLTNREG